MKLSCRCGCVEIEAIKTPIVSSECHCHSCRAAGKRLMALPGAPPFVEDNGGTRFVLYRKDRVRFAKGTDQFRAFRLTPQSPTRRVVAACCNTPVFLEFENGHWLSLYGVMWPQGRLPELEMRTMISDVADTADIGPELAKDPLSRPHQSLVFFAKLLGAWVMMGFKVPVISVAGEINA